jgi:hypothetical protein
MADIAAAAAERLARRAGTISILTDLRFTKRVFGIGLGSAASGLKRINKKMISITGSQTL